MHKVTKVISFVYNVNKKLFMVDVSWHAVNKIETSDNIHQSGKSRSNCRWEMCQNKWKLNESVLYSF